MIPVLVLALAAGQPAVPPRPPGLAPELAPPVHLTAGGRPIDVERSGHAAPCVADLDGDGRLSLLVGQFDGGKLRVYRNAAKAGPPRLEGYDWFAASGGPGTVPNGCRTSFAPAVADLDGDGKVDVVSGSRPGHVYLFRRTADGFAAPERAVDADGKDVEVGDETVVAAADWDGDRKADLIVGNLHGEVFFLRNVGERGRPAFTAAVRLTAGGAPVAAAGGIAAPCVADWDGDGRLDLVLGAGDGSVVWFRNEARTGPPRLGPARPLVPPSPAAAWDVAARGAGGWGERAKPCVFDWDGAGRPDLLLGDYVGGYEAKPRMTAAEADEERDALARLPGLRAEWAAAYKDFAAALDADPAGPRAADLRRRVTRLREEITRLEAVRARYAVQPMSHGYVWLFRRLPAEEGKR
ncbi:MAG TPA: VCBS repeat-containing protein [Urbifossiella sp.]|nr:VCBS repeat-containing protein [Urbifossiella sp.]